jgi:hypothetical protein
LHRLPQSIEPTLPSCFACEKERTPGGDDEDAFDEAEAPVSGATITSPPRTTATTSALRTPNRLADLAFDGNDMNRDMCVPLVELELELSDPAWAGAGDDRLGLPEI